MLSHLIYIIGILIVGWGLFHRKAEERAPKN